MPVDVLESVQQGKKHLGLPVVEIGIIRGVCQIQMVKRYRHCREMDPPPAHRGQNREICLILLIGILMLLTQRHQVIYRLILPALALDRNGVDHIVLGSWLTALTGGESRMHRILIAGKPTDVGQPFQLGAVAQMKILIASPRPEAISGHGFSGVTDAQQDRSAFLEVDS